MENKKSLYELNGEELELRDAILESDEDMSDEERREKIAILAKLDAQHNEGLERAAKVIRICDHEIGIRNDEIARLKAEIVRLKAINDSAESRKDYYLYGIKAGMIARNMSKFKTPLFTMYIKKKPKSLLVESVDFIPDDCIKIEKKVDNRKLTERLKAGECFEGVSLVGGDPENPDDVTIVIK